ncbi:hypothetical protein E3E12_00510 [Formicincola oecophyllae]|uniref:DedA family protein n=1 Tax=Formicincola oecophyllae TaxID=2558361 RepID=A0A4Y6U6G0_9PROT|nr:hypothetical protein [Formicincola oecophyllae]QDH12933.1 hypothetical protein E3E12_00510 [Formicincola oecophyllae]
MMSLPTLAASQPAWLKAALIVLGTFILEDVATVLAALAVQAGDVSMGLALGALYAGVAVGDMGLYGVGLLGSFWPWLAKRLTLPGKDKTAAWFSANLVKIVAISRFVPGARLPLYTACGFFHAPFLPFALTATLATLAWTTILFFLSMQVGHWLLAHAGQWRWVGIIGFIVAILAVNRLIAHLQRLSR